MQKEAANFPGCHFKQGDGYEYELIDRIVDMESPEHPGKRSRLWLTKDIVDVLENNTGTSEIQSIILDFPKYEKVFLSVTGAVQVKEVRKYDTFEF
ncbi:hypothetical protein P8452_74583 [Trifolium repens]|nr:hypothetical protein P8452_74582 [Trifolium repens]WJX93008.1 hypothetical protein P8452_74583 [Trifolium repens]